MAIPHPSQLLSPRQRLILRTSLAVAVLSLTAVALIYAGVLPRALRPKAHCPPLRTRAAAGCPACPAPSVPQTSVAAIAAPPLPAPIAGRYSVCEANGGNAMLRVLQLTAVGSAAIGVHCGGSVQLLAFDHDEPRRIARFTGRGPDRGLSETAGALSVLDLNGDGASDLIVGTTLRDAQGIPHGGTLYSVLRLANGGFADVKVLAPLSVGGAIPINLHTPGGANDLAVLRLEESRVGRSNEVFLLRGGASPVKALQLPAGAGMNQLAAADLDLDGNADLVLAGMGRTADVVYLDAKAQPLRRTALDPGPVQAVLVADLDGDGHDDLVIASDESRVILARSGSTAIAHPLALPQGFRVLRAVDWNGDGKVDLIGQHESSLLAMLQTSELAFERMELATWPDQELRVLGAMWSAGPSATGPAALALIASPVQARGQIELFITRQVPWVVASTLSAVPIPEAPLSLELALP